MFNSTVTQIDIQPSTTPLLTVSVCSRLSYYLKPSRMRRRRILRARTGLFKSSHMAKSNKNWNIRANTNSCDIPDSCGVERDSLETMTHWQIWRNIKPPAGFFMFTALWENVAQW